MTVEPFGVQWLLSLPGMLSLLFPLLWLVDSGKAGWLASPSRTDFGFFGARHDLICQVTPVNVLMQKPLFAHFRHGLPVRSRARSPALIAP